MFSFFIALGVILSACSSNVTTEAESTSTPSVTFTYTPITKNTATIAYKTFTVTPTATTTATATTEPTPTLEPTATQTPEVIDFDVMQDNEIYEVVGIPNPVEFQLESEIIPYKVLRERGDGQPMYVLYQEFFANGSKGNVVLAMNLETGVVEHAVYGEHRENGVEGVPILILTDQSVLERDKGWMGLRPGDLNAAASFADAFHDGLALDWWTANHPGEKFAMTKGMPSLDELEGFKALDSSQLLYLRNHEKNAIVVAIRAKMFEEIKKQQERGGRVMIKLDDRDRTEFDLANGTMVVRLVSSDEYSPYDVMTPIIDNENHRDNVNTSAEKEGETVTLEIKQWTYYPPEYTVHGFGGFMTSWLRYFFGGNYYAAYTNRKVFYCTTELTGIIFEKMCRRGDIPDELYDMYKANGYPLYMAGYGGKRPVHAERQPTEKCSAVQFIRP